MAKQTAHGRDLQATTCDQFRCYLTPDFFLIWMLKYSVLYLNLERNPSGYFSTYFFASSSLSNSSTAAFNCVSSPFTTVSGAFNTYISGSSSLFSR